MNEREFIERYGKEVFEEEQSRRWEVLVEADQHMHGSIDVIRILEGEISIRTEETVIGGL